MVVSVRAENDEHEAVCMQRGVFGMCISHIFLRANVSYCIIIICMLVQTAHDNVLTQSLGEGHTDRLFRRREVPREGLSAGRSNYLRREGKSGLICIVLICCFSNERLASARLA